jgi:RHS repeat-associated protein
MGSWSLQVLFATQVMGVCGSLQLKYAVYHGQQRSGTGVCGDSGRRVYLYPTEYLTYGSQNVASISTDPTGVKTYNICDHVGSVRATAGGNGAFGYDYEPFGTMLTGGTVRKGFIDKERDRESGQMNIGARQMDEPGFTSIDPAWEQFPAWSPYHYSMDNPMRFVDPTGATPYTFIIRSFQPDNAFAVGFDGDRRGFSAARTASSRINQYLTLETANGSIYDRRTYCDPSHHPMLGTRTAVAKYSIPDFASTSLLADGSVANYFETKYAASMPLLPTPDIDVSTSMYLREDKAKGYINVSGTVRGDQYPNAEALIVDPKGQTVFLGAFTRPNNSSPYRDLYGEGKAPMIDFNFFIYVDKDGNFTGVSANGKRYTIAAWNKMFENKDPNPQERAWEE